MIPLRHTLPRHTTPWVNHSLVAANLLLFTVQLFAGDRAEALIRALGFIPARLVHPSYSGDSLWHALITLGTSLFLHGGFVHLLGNMIYLWVFGGAVEEALGHRRYLLFFYLAGTFGSLVHTVFFPRSGIPSIGASGSIAGILGAFLVLHPRARILTVFPLVVYWAMAELRAAFFLPVWFGLQFFNGFLALAAAKGTQEVAGIAWWAHVGGFVFGVAIAGWRRLRT